MGLKMTKIKTFSEKRKKAAKKQKQKIWTMGMIGLMTMGAVITAVTILIQNKPMVAETKPKSEVVSATAEQETIKSVLDGTYDEKKAESDKAKQEALAAEQEAKKEEAETKQEEAIQARINEAVSAIEADANSKIQTANDNIKTLDAENTTLKQKVIDLQKENETLKKQVEAKK